MTDEHFAGAEVVAVRASRRRVGDPLSRQWSAPARPVRLETTTHQRGVVLENEYRPTRATSGASTQTQRTKNRCVQGARTLMKHVECALGPAEARMLRATPPWGLWAEGACAMKVFDATPGASCKDGAAIVAPEQSTSASAQPYASAGTSPESGVGTHTESPSRSPGGGEQPAAKTELEDGRGGAQSAHSIGIAEGSGEANGTRTAELTDAASPWYRRPGSLIAAAALTAGVGIVVSGPGEPGTAPGRTTVTSTPWSASFSLIATDIWEPPSPEPPPVAPPPPAAPAPAAPAWTPAWTPAREPPAAVPAPPPPPPPPELVLRYDAPVAVVVSITNNANQPAVGCVFGAVPVKGFAMVNPRQTLISP